MMSRKPFEVSTNIVPWESKDGIPTVGLPTYLFQDDAGNETTRPLGLIVARGTLLVLISPLDGSEQIENPFTQVEE